MYVPSFFFSYEQSSVLERCFEGQSPAATLGMPDFYFSFFPFHRIQHATIVSETFPCQLNSLLDTHQRVVKKKKIFTYRMLMTKLFSSTHWTERNGYSPFPNGYLCWFLVPGGTAAAMAGLSVLQVQSPGVQAGGGEPSVSQSPSELRHLCTGISGCSEACTICSSELN